MSSGRSTPAPKKASGAKEAQVPSLSNALPATGASLRLHLVFPHVAWAAEDDDNRRLALIGTYLRAATENRKPPQKDIVVLPAGILRSSLMVSKKKLEATVAPYLGHRLAMSGGIDDPDKSQWSFICGLSGDTPEWPVVVSKFKHGVKPGHPEDDRSCLWHGVELFALCCQDALCGCGGKPPASLRWTGKADLHIVIDNAHYHGDKDVGRWDVSQAGRIAFGLSRVVAPAHVGSMRRGLGAMAFFTSRDVTGRWWYPSKALPTPKVEDGGAGEGAARLWYRIVALN